MADIVIIQSNTTFQAEKLVYALINAGFRAEKAEIHYNKLKGLQGTKESNQYPLTLTGILDRMPTIIKVNGVTAGYGGSGPNAMVGILKYAGFIFDKDDILTERYCNSDGYIGLIYSK